MRKYFFIVGVILLVPFFASAQEGQDDFDIFDLIESEGIGSEDSAKFEMVANTNIRDSKFYGIDGGSLHAIFYAVNEFDKVQAGITYTASILNNKGVTIDEESFDEDVFSLAPGERTLKEIKYPISPFLNCEQCSLMIRLKTVTGLPLSQYIFEEKFDVESMVENALEIEKTSCYIHIEGDDEKYSLDYGVDFAKEEQVFLRCKIKNENNNDIELIPQFSILQKDISGKVESSEMLEKEVINKNLEKELQFKIPTPEKPQSYNAEFLILNSNKDQISNAIDMHFVVQGESASVRGILLDKSSYKKGETAMINAIVTQSADLFFGSRKMQKMQDEGTFNEQKIQEATLDIVISSNGQLCGKSENIKTDFGSSDFPVKIVNDCEYPEVEVTINNGKGEELDKLIEGVTKKDNSSSTGSAQASSKKELIPTALKIVLLLTIILIVGILSFRFLKNKNITSLFVIFGIGSVLFLANAFSVNAATYRVTDEKWWGDYGGNPAVDAYVTISFDKPDYCADDKIRVTSSGWSVGCTNWNHHVSLKWWKITGASNININQSMFWKDCTDYYRDFCVQSNVTKERNAPTTVGNYEAWFKGAAYEYRLDGVNVYKSLCEYYGSHVHGGFTWYSSYNPARCIGFLSYNNDIKYPFSVSDCSENAVCGDRDGVVYEALPEDQNWPAGTTFCGEAGDGVNWPVAFPEQGQTVTWICEGSGPNGVDAYCSARRREYSPGICNPNSAVDTYPYTATSPTTPLCSQTEDVPVTPEFSGYGGESLVEWTCTGLNAPDATCSAMRQRPAAKCIGGTNIPTHTKPSGPYCEPSGDHIVNGPELVNNEWVWTCTHKIPGAVPQTSPPCKAPIPEPVCGPAHGTEVNNKPANFAQLCGCNNSVCSSSEVIFNNQTGNWEWTCTHVDYAKNNPAYCEAKTCLSSDDLLQYPSIVYLTNDGQSIDVSVHCDRRVCCEIDMTPTGGTPDEIICSGEDGEFELPASGDYDAVCYFDDCTDDSCKVTKKIVAQTMCAAKSCNSQGTCQSTPVQANSLDASQCKSSCNSNADCTKGRLIETKP